MPKSINQKAKLIRLLEIFQKKTDENHKLNTAELIEELARYDIYAERKSIYDDIECLRDLNYDIILDRSGNHRGYYLASRTIEKHELMPLVDAISSSRFITLNKSRELIKKLENELSIYDANELDREVYVTNRIKSENESIYYAIDAIQKSIRNKTMVTFLYCEWNENKELEPRHNGQIYKVAPISLCWDDDKYYLVAFDENADDIRHYRVDKMKNIEASDEKIATNEQIDNFDIVTYSNKTFGMYGGKEEQVSIIFPQRLIGVIIDRFGKEPTFRPMHNKAFYVVRVSVTVSSQFFGWLTGLGNEVKIMAPDYVAKEYKEYLRKIIEVY